jgi:hypothetical protein
MCVAIAVLFGKLTALPKIFSECGKIFRTSFHRLRTIFSSLPWQYGTYYGKTIPESKF